MLNYVGVYEIACVVNNQKYIGSTTVSFNRRFAQHKHLLLTGKHGSIYMQRSWDKYGADAFGFRPLVVCDASQVLDQRSLRSIL